MDPREALDEVTNWKSPTAIENQNSVPQCISLHVHSIRALKLLAVCKIPLQVTSPSNLQYSQADSVLNVLQRSRSFRNKISETAYKYCMCKTYLDWKYSL
jgi:hypothetical protein